MRPTRGCRSRTRRSPLLRHVISPRHLSCKAAPIPDRSAPTQLRGTGLRVSRRCAPASYGSEAAAPAAHPRTLFRTLDWVPAQILSCPDVPGMWTTALQACDKALVYTPE